MIHRQKELKIMITGIACLLVLFCAVLVYKKGSEKMPEVTMSEESVISTENPAKEIMSSESIISEKETLVLDIREHYTTNTGNPDNLYYIDENGCLWGCGRNDYGQLGQGTQDFDFYEDMIKIAEEVIHVDYSQNGFTIFLTENHKLYGMGTSATGALQEYEEITYEMSINRDKYVVSSPKLLLEEVAYAKCGNGDIVCLLEDGSVWTWGTVWREGVQSYCISEPEKILEDAVLVTGGWHSHAALLEDGSVWTWGYNYAGNCGVEGEIVISDPVKVAEDAVMVWTGKTTNNVDCYDISEFNGEYERYLENTIIQKADGTYWACGIGLGGEEKTLDRYWEVDEYVVECTSKFVQVENDVHFLIASEISFEGKIVETDAEETNRLLEILKTLTVEEKKDIYSVPDYCILLRESNQSVLCLIEVWDDCICLNHSKFYDIESSELVTVLDEVFGESVGLDKVTPEEILCGTPLTDSGEFTQKDIIMYNGRPALLLETGYDDSGSSSEKCYYEKYLCCDALYFDKEYQTTYMIVQYTIYYDSDGRVRDTYYERLYYYDYFTGERVVFQY